MNRQTNEEARDAILNHMAKRYVKVRHLAPQFCTKCLVEVKWKKVLDKWVCFDLNGFEHDCRD